MSEPAKRKDLKLVDENYKPPQKPSNDEVLEAHQAAGIREGLRRGREKLANEIRLASQALDGANKRVAEMTAAHEAHLKTATKASYHQGALHAGLFGLVLVAAALYAGPWLVTWGWGMSVSDERIPRAVPVLEDSYTPPDYERHPREPASATPR